MRNDGSTFRAGVTLTALRDDDGALLGFVKVTRDVSAQRAKEAKLAAAETAGESQRVAEEAIRLKTIFEPRAADPPKCSIGVCVTSGTADAGAVLSVRLVNKIRNSRRHLLHIVDDVLDVTRLDAGPPRRNA